MRNVRRNIVAGFMTMPVLVAALAAAQPRSEPPSQAPVRAGKPVNNRCPIGEGEVDSGSPMRKFRGFTVGFCCLGCEGKWDTKPEAEKVVFLAKHVPVVELERAAAKVGVVSPGVQVARDFLDACGRIDVRALDALFVGEGRARVLENASDEGTWEQYRDHHLIPERKEMKGLRFAVIAEV